MSELASYTDMNDQSKDSTLASTLVFCASGTIDHFTEKQLEAVK